MANIPANSPVVGLNPSRTNFSRKSFFAQYSSTTFLRSSIGRVLHDIPENITAFSEEFIEAKKIQWLAFRKRLKQVNAPENFADVVDAIRDFLQPIVVSLRSGKVMPENWNASGFWK